MSFCLETLERLLDTHRKVVRVVIAKVEGSSPREVGAALWLHDAGMEGSIGGGAMEYAAIKQARSLLACGEDRFETFALGPSLGQCCGGVVSLLYENFTCTDLSNIRGKDFYARDVRAVGVLPDDIFVETISRPKRIVWLYGAGHVGRALVHHLAPITDIALFWWDESPARFPDQVPDSVRTIPTDQPTEMLKFAPDHAEHLVMTYSHALDFQICDAVLSRRCASLGVIGSKTKAARFRKRLRALGHDTARLQCPIGDPSLGKTPHAIALGVSYHLLHCAEVPARRQKRVAS